MGGRQGSPGETSRKTCSDASARKRRDATRSCPDGDASAGQRRSETDRLPDPTLPGQSVVLRSGDDLPLTHLPKSVARGRDGWPGKRHDDNRRRVIHGAFVRKRRSETDRLPDPTFRLSKRLRPTTPLKVDVAGSDPALPNQPANAAAWPPILPDMGGLQGQVAKLAESA
jgi:hypothetical protein